MNEEGNESFEDRVRAIAWELSRSVERLAELDMDEVARTIGVDAERAKGLVDTAGRWFSAYAETFRQDAGFGDADQSPAANDPQTRAGGGTASAGRPDRRTRSGAQRPGFRPLDRRARQQPAGGGWPGSAPRDAVGLVGELRARDWIDANGEVTLVGHSALGRWLEANQAA